MADRKKKIEEKVEKVQGEIEEIEKRLKELEHHSFSGCIAVKDIGLYDRIGRRDNMEDNHCIVDCFRGNPFEAYFGVYDGHGGKMSADYVADFLHKNFEEFLGKCKTVKEAYVKAFKKTDYDLASTYKADEVGTTVVTCYLTEYTDPDHSDKKVKKLFTANCGDARAVLSRNGVALRISKDHKATLKEEQRRVEDDGAIVMRGYLNMRIAVTRAIGDSSLKNWVVCDPFYSETSLKETDDILIIACDGVWDVMGDQEAVNLMQKEKERSCEELAKILVNKAFNMGSGDNITAIIVKL